jgi:hypothetical protein
MSAKQAVQAQARVHGMASLHRHRLLGAPTGALVALLVGACGSQHSTEPARWSCETTRPALNGTWVGTLDREEIVLYIVERECTGSLDFPYVGWPLDGTWTWNGIVGQITGGGPLVGTLSGPYSASKKLTYSIGLNRGFGGSISLRVGNLPAGSSITAELSGAWATPPTPPPGPLELRRR